MPLVPENDSQTCDRCGEACYHVPGPLAAGQPLRAFALDREGTRLLCQTCALAWALGQTPGTAVPV